MPKITYMSIEQAEEEIRQHEVTERIRRFATSDPEVAKQREAEGWGYDLHISSLQENLNVLLDIFL